jgi:hypothetical protein
MSEPGCYDRKIGYLSIRDAEIMHVSIKIQGTFMIFDGPTCFILGSMLLTGQFNF